MDRSPEYLELDIKQYFKRNFNLELQDSPQVLNNYLYLEFWLFSRQIKLRLYYPLDREDFMNWTAGNRFNWIEHEMIKGLAYIGHY